MKRKIVYNSPFRQFVSVIFALFFRELKTRFGQQRFGVFWTIAEPMVHIVVLLFVFVFIREHMMPQVPFELFLITGVIPFFVFRKTVTGLMGSIDANKALFAYTPVKPIDTYITRTILEVVIYGIIFVILIFYFGFLVGLDVSVANPFELMLIFALLVLMAFSFGIILSILLQIFPMLKIAIGLIMRLLYFLSCIMYPLWVIPSQYAYYLKFNPVLHLIELFRYNFFSYYPHSEGINIYYPLFVTLIALFIALYFYRVRRLALAAKQ
ncbi:MAG: ABC transporter permease [Campylobacteraceae bacterium]|jgi:capsular polysaccharide transport system permease protein|nr:ABC transporter permease [Campylobacteraceae bacterium]